MNKPPMKWPKSVRLVVLKFGYGQGKVGIPLTSIFGIQIKQLVVVSN